MPFGNLPPGGSQNFIPVMKGGSFTFVSTEFQASYNLKEM